MTHKADITVIGAGLMGVGIAQVFASHGHAVILQDPVEAARETVSERMAANMRLLGQDKALLAPVSTTDSLAEAVADADVVIEAAPEKPELKQAIFADIASHARADAILASNTSVIPIATIGARLDDASQLIGTHWWNPPFLVPLVEVVEADRSNPECVAAMIDLLRAVGKRPVHVKRDVAGFVGNRLQHALWREAIAIVAAGICDAETVDIVVKNSFGMRLPVLGPLENADLVGLDLTLDIHETILPEIDRSPAPSPLLREKLRAGQLGFKTGRGFRNWTPEQMAELRQRLLAHLRAMTENETVA